MLRAAVIPRRFVFCALPVVVSPRRMHSFFTELGRSVRARWLAQNFSLAAFPEIAQAALYLTSDESSFVTGAALAVDGGRTFH